MKWHTDHLFSHIIRCWESVCSLENVIVILRVAWPRRKIDLIIMQVSSASASLKKGIIGQVVGSGYFETAVSQRKEVTTWMVLYATCHSARSVAESQNP